MTNEQPRWTITHDAVTCATFTQLCEEELDEVHRVQQLSSVLRRPQFQTAALKEEARQIVLSC